MRPTAALMHLALAVSSVAPVVSAWPNWLPRGALIVRADESGSSAAASPSATDSGSASATGSSKGAQSTGNLNTASPTNSKSSGSGTASGTASGSNKKTTPAPTHTTFAPDAPAGGANMIIPATTALGTALYKISDYVSFSWNYTSLLGTPTAIDVLASCSVARATWTLTANMSFATSVNYVWDTKKQANDASQPLLTEQYTLIIKDSDAQINDIPDPGYLGSNSALSFGLYAGQPYSNLSDWTCPGCHASAAPPAIGGQAFKFATAMSLVTVLSFTWFVASLGIN